MRQYQEYGLKRRVPLIGAGTTTDEHVLPFMGDEALGVITALHYSAALDTPANRTFAAAYRARYKKIPSYYAESMYTGGKWLVAAIDAVGGRVEDPRALLDALRSVRLADLPRGPVELDEYGNPIENVYVRKVERVNGELQNTVIDTFPRCRSSGSTARRPTWRAALLAVTNQPPGLALENVSREFGGLRAVDGVTLVMRPGERHAVIGPNGAGKTTLFNVISGELAATAGRSCSSATTSHGLRRISVPPGEWRGRFRSRGCSRI